MSCKNCTQCRKAFRPGKVACVSWHEYSLGMEVPDRSPITGNYEDDVDMYGPEHGLDTGWAKLDVSLEQATKGVGTMTKDVLLVDENDFCALFAERVSLSNAA